MGPEKERVLLGLQLWFRRARRGVRARPRGVQVELVRV